MLVVDDIKYKTRRNLVNKTVAYDHNASGAITIDASGTNAIVLDLMRIQEISLGVQTWCICTKFDSWALFPALIRIRIVQMVTT